MAKPRVVALTAALLCVAGSRCLADDLPAAGSLRAKTPVAAIPDVVRFGQLRATPAIETADGWRIQVGLGESDASAGPWRLLYCLASRKGAGANVDRPLPRRGTTRQHGQALGPVFVRQSSSLDAPRLETLKAVVERPLGEGLYCQAIALGWAGEYHIQVVSSSGAPLASRTLAVDDPSPCYWQPFAELHGRRSLGETPYVVRERGFAATLAFEGTTPLWKPDRRVELGDAERLVLPGHLPSDPFWWGGVARRKQPARDLAPTLRLSQQQKKSLIVVESPVDLLDWPDLHLLARWWVNGEPVIPARSDELKMLKLGRLISTARRMQIAWRLPPDLGALQVGDKIGLQVLFSPAMHQQLLATRVDNLPERLASHGGGIAVPLLSNRLDLVVTKKMLGERTDE